MQYAVKAVRHMQSVSIMLEATDPKDARRQAESQGYAVVAVKLAAARRSIGLGFRRAPVFPLLHFNQSLLILLKAGLSVVEVIETLADRETRADAKQVLTRLMEQLQVGMSFSAALEAQPAVFPPLYVASVRANEHESSTIASAVTCHKETCRPSAQVVNATRLLQSAVPILAEFVAPWLI